MATDRKRVHRIAVRFKCRSRSVGKGADRHTVIFKTEKTITNLDDAGYGRQSEKRMDVGGDDAGRAHGGGGGGGGGGGWGKGREGMVVGASAPELSATNRGRLMLEKMGYQTGMRLGVEGNQGIREPIAVVVKTSKACLG